jgi:hypothetical protein
MRPATRCRHIVDIVVDFNLETADNFGLKVRTGNGEETVIGYDVAASELYVDRTRSGNVSFSRDFPGVQRAPLTASDGEVRLRILVDWSSVEVFTDAGHRVITDQIFPSSTRGLSCSPKAARSWWTHSPSGKCGRSGDSRSPTASGYESADCLAQQPAPQQSVTASRRRRARVPRVGRRRPVGR